MTDRIPPDPRGVLLDRIICTPALLAEARRALETVPEDEPVLMSGVRLGVAGELRHLLSTDELRARYHRLVALERTRALSADEQRMRRALRRTPDVHQPTAPEEFRAIAAARLKRQRRGVQLLMRQAARPLPTSTEDACSTA